MKKLITMALVALFTGTALAAPQQQPPKPDTTKAKKVKPRSSAGNIRISGDTTEYKVVKDSLKR